MRCTVVTKLVLGCVLLSLIGGCELLRMNPGREFATTLGGYAGRFRIAHGRWPADVNELEEFVCMRGRADRFGLAQMSCDELVSKPYRTQMTPHGAHLQMRLFDSARKPICSLTVFAPPARPDAAVFPMIVIKTSVFSCRGDP